MIGSLSGATQGAYLPSSRPATPPSGGEPAGADADPRTAPSDDPAKTRSEGAQRPQEIQEQRQLEALKARDREVRAHEAAHLAAAGGLARSGPSFTFQRGPDGRSYAVGGEVSIDVSPGRSPEETIAKAARIRAAALAPSDPSGQDLNVAAQAGRLAAQARIELAAQRIRAYAEQQDTPAAGTKVDRYA